MSRPFEQLVGIGQVVKPQGRHGEILVEPWSDRQERFPRLERAFVPGPQGGSREVRVERVWPHKGRFVLKLVGVDSIEAAEAYRGLELRIGEESLATLPDGSYYHYQLMGLQVFDRGTLLGRVADLMETGAGASVLVVRGPAGETLLPLAADFVQQIELDAGRIDVHLPQPVSAEA